jgi:hypothetical protein
MFTSYSVMRRCQQDSYAWEPSKTMRQHSAMGNSLSSSWAPFVKLPAYRACLWALPCWLRVL